MPQSRKFRPAAVTQLTSQRRGAASHCCRSCTAQHLHQGMDRCADKTDLRCFCANGWIGAPEQRPLRRVSVTVRDQASGFSAVIACEPNISKLSMAE